MGILFSLIAGLSLMSFAMPVDDASLESPDDFPLADTTAVHKQRTYSLPCYADADIDQRGIDGGTNGPGSGGDRSTSGSSNAMRSPQPAACQACSLKASTSIGGPGQSPGSRASASSASPVSKRRTHSCGREGLDSLSAVAVAAAANAERLSSAVDAPIVHESRRRKQKSTRPKARKTDPRYDISFDSLQHSSFDDLDGGSVLLEDDDGRVRSSTGPDDTDSRDATVEHEDVDYTDILKRRVNAAAASPGHSFTEPSVLTAAFSAMANGRRAAPSNIHQLPMQFGGAFVVSSDAGGAVEVSRGQVSGFASQSAGDHSAADGRGGDGHVQPLATVASGAAEDAAPHVPMQEISLPGVGPLVVKEPTSVPADLLLPVDTMPLDAIVHEIERIKILVQSGMVGTNPPEGVPSGNSVSGLPDDMRELYVHRLVVLRLRMHELKKTELAMGVDRVFAAGHSFLPTQFAAPSFCDHCSRFIWGIYYQGYQCADCQYNVHKRCLSELSTQCVAVKGPGTQYSLQLCPEAGLDDQEYQCAGCKKLIGFKWLGSEARLCDYSGEYLCTDCHWNDRQIIPARALHNWDFKPRKVSRASKAMLALMFTRPVLDLEHLNPQLFRYLEELAEVKSIRSHLVAMRGYIMTCRIAKQASWFPEFNGRPHLVSTTQLYSLQDLADVNAGTFLSFLSQMRASCASHIRGCELCTAKGFVCELCQDEGIIFPFDPMTTACAACTSLYHTKCFAAPASCPKCERLSKRRSGSQRSCASSSMSAGDGD
eukprot:Opistho-2@92307